MKYLILTAALLIATAVTACNTIAGAGDDIKAGGSKLQSSADNNKTY